MSTSYSCRYRITRAPARRNIELGLLCFAALITFVALLIVEANQNRGFAWDIVSYILAYPNTFSSARISRSDASLRTPTRCCCPSVAAPQWPGTGAHPPP